MTEKHFFEIAIYRCSNDRFLADCEQSIQKYFDYLYRTSGAPRDEAPRTYRLAEERIRREWGTWRYNQVIGWIRLFTLHNQVRGEYWFTQTKRIHKNMSGKKMSFKGKAVEISLEPEQSSKAIYEEVCSALRKARKEKPFKGRLLDLEPFHNVGPHINWRTLLGFEQNVDVP